jgi:two-component system nitrate/nitrite response regulator NarL
MLRKMPELQMVGEASDGLHAVQKAQELRPDLIVLDIGLPTLNGIEAAQQISTVVPGATVLFVSQNTDPDVIEAALGVGIALDNRARGYVLKQNVNTELLPAVEATLRGEHFLSTGLTHRLRKSSPGTQMRSAARQRWPKQLRWHLNLSVDFGAE